MVCLVFTKTLKTWLNLPSCLVTMLDVKVLEFICCNVLKIIHSIHFKDVITWDGGVVFSGKYFKHPCLKTLLEVVEHQDYKNVHKHPE